MGAPQPLTSAAGPARPPGLGGVRALFVYGTLRPGETNKFARYLHAHATHLGRGTMRGRLYRFDWHPGAVASDDPADRVIGDAFEIDPANADEVIARLDAYEGRDFPRSEVDVSTGDGRSMRCRTYLYAGCVDEENRIASGGFP